MMLAGLNDNTLFIIIAALFLLFGIIIFNFNTRINTLQEHLNNQNTILNDLLNNLGLQLGGNQPSQPPVLAETNINETYNNNKINVSDNEEDETDDSDDDSDETDDTDDESDDDTSNKNDITIVDETDNNVEINALQIDEIKDMGSPLVEDIKFVELEDLAQDNEPLNIVNSTDDDDDDDDDEDEDEDEEGKNDTDELLSQMSTNIHNNGLKKLKVTELRDLVISKELVDRSKAKSLTKPQLLDLLN